MKTKRAFWLPNGNPFQTKGWTRGSHPRRQRLLGYCQLLPFIEPLRTLCAGIILEPVVSKAEMPAQQTNTLDNAEHDATPDSDADDVGCEQSALLRRIKERIG